MPLLWVLTGPKAGDNAQVMKAAWASALPFVQKRIVLLPTHAKTKPMVRPSLDGIDLQKSDAIAAPWPDVVLVIGRHLSRVALWIKQQSQGATRIVLFNAPKGRASDFDLIVLPPYYRNSFRTDVLSLRMPLIGIDADVLARAHESFAAEFAEIPRPLNVLLVGGDMGQRKLEASFVTAVLREMQQGFAAPGSICVATSPRTAASVSAAIESTLRPQDRLFRWSAQTASPYLGLLAHGDSFTVTADSLSMLIEVARLGKPLVIAEPPPRKGFAGLLGRISDLWRPRDLRHALQMLYDGGHAVPLGKAPHSSQNRLPDDTALVAEAVRDLAGIGSGRTGRTFYNPTTKVGPIAS